MSATRHIKNRVSITTSPPTCKSQPLAGHVRESLEQYFAELNGQPPSNLYDLVLSEIEQPLLDVVMSETRGNLSKAAAFLGLNRATLRKKLKKYGIEN